MKYWFKSDWTLNCSMAMVIVPKYSWYPNTTPTQYVTHTLQEIIPDINPIMHYWDGIRRKLVIIKSWDVVVTLHFKIENFSRVLLSLLLHLHLTLFKLNQIRNCVVSQLTTGTLCCRNSAFKTKSYFSYQFNVS